jgi:hypothetical protein
MRHQERIALNDSLLDIFIKMSEGNPGGLSVLKLLYERSEAIDPDAALGSLSTILALDTYGIYGSRIWMLYKYVCRKDIVALVVTLRAVQLGILSINKLTEAIDNKSGKVILDVVGLFEKVKARLPQFKKFIEEKVINNDTMVDTCEKIRKEL